MNKMQALHHFWSSFGLPAYDGTSVPDVAALPYITYEAVSDEFGNTVPATASLWYRSTSWADITAKEMQISDYITRGGLMIRYDDGAMWIQKASPWAQRMSDPNDDMVRRIVMNVTIEFMD